MHELSHVTGKQGLAAHTFCTVSHCAKHHYAVMWTVLQGAVCCEANLRVHLQVQRVVTIAETPSDPSSSQHMHYPAAINAHITRT